MFHLLTYCSLNSYQVPWRDLAGLLDADEVATAEMMQRTLMAEVAKAPVRLSALQKHGKAVLWHLNAAEVTRNVLIAAHLQRWEDHVSITQACAGTLGATPSIP